MFGSIKYTQAEYDGVTRQLSEVTAINLRLEANLTEAQDLIQTLDADKLALSNQLAQHKLDSEKVKQKHMQELEQMKKTVNQKVYNSLSSIGVPQFASEIYSEVAEKSDVELLMQFQRLTGGEQTEFYRKNKEALTRATLSKT